MNRRMACVAAVLVLALQAGAEEAATPQERRLAETRAWLDEKYPAERAEKFKAPFLVAIEVSSAYNAELLIEDLLGIVKTLEASLRKEFDGLVDFDRLEREEVCTFMIFPTTQDFVRKCSPASGSRGQVIPARAVAFLARDSRQLYESLFHFGTLLLLDCASKADLEEHSNRRGLPSFWFAYGYAEWFACFKRTAAGGFLFGELNSEEALRLLRKPEVLPPLSDLISLARDDYQKKVEAGGTGPRSPQTLQAQAWAFVLFLQTANDGKRREALRRYAKAEFAWKGGLEAAKEAFGDLEALDREFREFLRELNK